MRLVQPMPRLNIIDLSVEPVHDRLINYLVYWFSFNFLSHVRTKCNFIFYFIISREVLTNDGKKCIDRKKTKTKTKYIQECKKFEKLFTILEKLFFFFQLSSITDQFAKKCQSIRQFITFQIVNITYTRFLLSLAYQKSKREKKKKKIQ